MCVKIVTNISLTNQTYPDIPKFTLEICLNAMYAPRHTPHNLFMEVVDSSVNMMTAIRYLSLQLVHFTIIFLKNVVLYEIHSVKSRVTESLKILKRYSEVVSKYKNDKQYNGKKKRDMINTSIALQNA